MHKMLYKADSEKVRVLFSRELVTKQFLEYYINKSFVKLRQML